MSGRRNNDAYFTPAWAVDILLARLPGLGTVYEPCAGLGHITHAIEASGQAAYIVTNDLDADMKTDFHDDATQLYGWERGAYDWVITNPPFNLALPIVKHAIEHAETGVAMLLRLSWLEPTKELSKQNPYPRAGFLAEHPPNRLIVLPRFSFTANGKTDSVTCAWFVWYKDLRPENWLYQRIEVVPDRAPKEGLPL